MKYEMIFSFVAGQKSIFYCGKIARTGRHFAESAINHKVLLLLVAKYVMVLQRRSISRVVGVGGIDFLLGDSRKRCRLMERENTQISEKVCSSNLSAFINFFSVSLRFAGVVSLQKEKTRITEKHGLFIGLRYVYIYF